MYLFLNDHRYFLYFVMSLLEGGVLVVLLVVFSMMIVRNSIIPRFKKNEADEPREPMMTQV